MGMPDILSIIAGLLLLYVGAEALIRGSVSLAARLGVSPFLIGLTVVAYGTSAPELVVSVTANFGGHGDIAAGNVIGSNIFNIAVILGISALIYPLRIRAGILRRDLPILAIASFVPLILFRHGHVGRIEGVLFLAGIIIYTLAEVRWARREPEAVPLDRRAHPGWSLARDLLFVLPGIAVLALGSHLLREGAVALARDLGISEAVIGLTVVSAGTSLPELAASVVAALRRHPELSVGNIIGSNMFNIFAVFGISSLIRPIDCPDIKPPDLLVMIFVSVLILPLARSRSTLSRWEGALLVVTYTAYLCFRWFSR
jgi:cation:H+ antiporter